MKEEPAAASQILVWHKKLLVKIFSPFPACLELNPNSLSILELTMDMALT